GGFAILGFAAGLLLVERTRPNETFLLFHPSGRPWRLDAAQARRRLVDPADRQPGRGVFRIGHRLGESRRDAWPIARSGHIGQSAGTRHRTTSHRTAIWGRGRSRHMTDLLQVRDLHVRFAAPGGFIRAVTGVSLRVRPQSIVALVGESGSGKSVVSQTILRILPRSGVITRGEVLFADPRLDGRVVDIAKLPSDSAELRAIRGGRISIIFQEPMTSLSPVHTVGNQVGEALRLHRDAGTAEARDLTAEMLRLVGFPDPSKALKTYPFELSGGLRQRAMIAMALVCSPALLIADEPTTALDVTIQAQILRLIKDLQKELGMALLMITHDLGVGANVADDVVVMYRGKVVESGDLHDIYRDPQHDYLKALLHAVPRFDMAGERLVPIREITAATGHLLKEKPTAPPTTSFNP